MDRQILKIHVHARAVFLFRRLYNFRNQAILYFRIGQNQFAPRTVEVSLFGQRGQVHNGTCPPYHGGGAERIVIQWDQLSRRADPAGKGRQIRQIGQLRFQQGRRNEGVSVTVKGGACKRRFVTVRDHDRLSRTQLHTAAKRPVAPPQVPDTHAVTGRQRAQGIAGSDLYRLPWNADHERLSDGKRLIRRDRVARAQPIRIHAETPRDRLQRFAGTDNMNSHGITSGIPYELSPVRMMKNFDLSKTLDITGIICYTYGTWGRKQSQVRRQKKQTQRGTKKHGF